METSRILVRFIMSAILWVFEQMLENPNLV